MEIKINKDDAIRQNTLIGFMMTVFPDFVEDVTQLIRSSKTGITLEILPTKRTQTDKQRNYYWKQLRSFAAFTGNTPDEMHEHILRECYGSEQVATKLGIIIRPQKRSSEADRDEYSELIETLIRVASFFGFVVPPPIIDEKKYGYLIKE